MKPTLEDLKKIIEDQNKERERISMAIHLKICPECGADLIDISIPYKEGWWIFKSNETRIVRKCKENEKHYSNIIRDSFLEDMMYNDMY